MENREADIDNTIQDQQILTVNQPRTAFEIENQGRYPNFSINVITS